MHRPSLQAVQALQRLRFRRRLDAAQRAAARAKVDELVAHSAGLAQIRAAAERHYVPSLVLRRFGDAPAHRNFARLLISTLLDGYRGIQISADELGELIGCDGRHVRRVVALLRGLRLVVRAHTFHDRYAREQGGAYVGDNGRVYDRSFDRNVYTLHWDAQHIANGVVKSVAAVIGPEGDLCTGAARANGEVVVTDGGGAAVLECPIYSDLDLLITANRSRGCEFVDNPDAQSAGRVLELAMSEGREGRAPWRGRR